MMQICLLYRYFLPGTVVVNLQRCCSLRKFPTALAPPPSVRKNIQITRMVPMSLNIQTYYPSLSESLVLLKNMTSKNHSFQDQLSIPYIPFLLCAKIDWLIKSLAPAAVARIKLDIQNDAFIKCIRNLQKLSQLVFINHYTIVST